MKYILYVHVKYFLFAEYMNMNRTIGVWRGVSKEVEDSYKLPALRAGHY
jgi:hypothetical protein